MIREIAVPVTNCVVDREEAETILLHRRAGIHEDLDHLKVAAARSELERRPLVVVPFRGRCTIRQQRAELLHCASVGRTAHECNRRDLSCGRADGPNINADASAQRARTVQNFSQHRL